MIDTNKIKNAQLLSELMDLASLYASRRIGKEVTVNMVTMDDKDSILEISEKCFPEWDDGETAYLDYCLASQESLAFIIKHKEEGIAYVIGDDAQAYYFPMDIDDETYYSCFSAVIKDYRRNGLYSLLRQLWHIAVSGAGYSRILLHSLDKANSHGAHSSMGYTDLMRLENYYSDGDAALLMEKALTQEAVQTDVDFIKNTEVKNA